MRDMPELPLGRAGYRVVDLEAFLAAASERIASLEAAIASAQSRRDVPIITTADQDAVSIRRQVAAVWLDAQHRAKAIRAAADADAAGVLQHATFAAKAKDRIT